MAVDWTSVTPHLVVKKLNHLLETDPQAVECLFKLRFHCNDALRDDPEFGCVEYAYGQVCGVLTILNALFGHDADGKGPIRVLLDEETEEIVRFEVAPFRTQRAKDQANKRKRKKK